MVPNNTQTTDRRDLAREFLRRAQDDYERARDTRTQLAALARAHGLTNQQIANAYGVTEGAIRAMIKRTGDHA